MTRMRWSELAVGLGLIALIPGCKQPSERQPSESKPDLTLEERACVAEARWTIHGVPRDEQLSPARLAQCVADQREFKAERSLSDADYEAMLECKIAAKSNGEQLGCVVLTMQSELDAALASVKPELERRDRAAAESLAEALPKLDAHVASGVIRAEDVAKLRSPDPRVKVVRLAATALDALELIESGRVDAEHPLRIHPQPLGSRNSGDPEGLDAAELSFVDPKTGATVARLAPLNRAEFSLMGSQVIALVRWLLEQPNTRRLELIVVSREHELDDGLDMPLEVDKLQAQLEAAGLAERPIITLDGEPLSFAQWQTL